MNRMAIAAVGGLFAGLAVGAWLAGGEPETRERAAVPLAESSGAAVPLEERLQRLEQLVAEERDARLALEDTLTLLFEELERVESAGSSAAAEQEARSERAREARSSESRNQSDWIARYQERRVSRLVEGGFTEEEARQVLEQESAAQFQAMQSMWEAQRNNEPVDLLGMDGGPQSVLRANMGDAAYERYLEAQGQPTAIQITQVLSGSPGKNAGLQPGDQLVSYNGERIYSVSELRSRSMQGSPGEDVVIEVERDGMRMQLTVPRGPIGITGSGASLRGMSWWGG